MKLLLRFLLLPGLFVGLLGGCSEKIEPEPITYSQLLTGTTQKSWRLVSIIEVDQGQASRTITPAQYGIPVCFADDLYTFYANDERKFEISEGATKCDAADEDILLTDTWTLINADASLEFAFPIAGLKYPFTIKNLTANVLAIEYYFQDIDASIRYTFNATTTK